MSFLEFILGLVDALAWPGVVLFVAVRFKDQITGLFQAVRRLRLGQLEADLERVRDEAAATIAQLRDLALALAAPAAGSLPGPIDQLEIVLFSTPPVYERLEQGKAVVDALVKLGIERDEAESLMLTPLMKHIRNGHVEWIREVANEAVPSDKSDTRPPWKKHELPIIDQLKAGDVSTSEVRTELAKVIGDVPEELEERLLDLEYFDETGELRRPSVPPWGDDEDVA